MSALLVRDICRNNVVFGKYSYTQGNNVLFCSDHYNLLYEHLIVDLSTFAQFSYNSWCKDSLSAKDQNMAIFCDQKLIRQSSDYKSKSEIFKFMKLPL